MARVLYESHTRVTNPYQGEAHTGVDLKVGEALWANEVYAHSDGKVVVAVDGRDHDEGTVGLDTYGNYVDIDHGNGNMTRYAHMEKGSIKVKVGQSVTSSTVIGVIGMSGNATGPHLHFEVFVSNKRVDPEPYLLANFGEVIETPKFFQYQTHDSRYGWNPNVSVGSSEYAGNFGYNVDGMYIDNYRLRVHDMVKNQWLPWVQDRNDYAGNLGNAIDAVQIDSLRSNVDVSYRVHFTGGEWSDWLCDNTKYAGTLGRAIDAVQVGWETVH